MIETVARGIEHEYCLNTYPPLGLEENQRRRELIAQAIEGLVSEGIILPLPWSLTEEVGNFDYEVSLQKLWPREKGPYQVARNGMRIYDDALHLEIATPVYNSAWEAVIYNKVSEIFAYKAAERVGRLRGQQVFAYTSNVSLINSGGRYEAVACGTHGNTAVSRRVFNPSTWKQVESSFLPYAVTRVLLFGSGGYVPCTYSDAAVPRCSYEEAYSSKLVGDQVAFVISPRSHFINSISSLDTTVKRGFLNTRDEPHADDKYWRFHDINFEGLRSPFQIYMRDIFQALMLMALDKGYLIDPPRLKNPCEAVQMLSFDVDELSWLVQLENGQCVDAVRDILQGYYLKKIKDMLAAEKIKKDSEPVVSLLETTLNLLVERKLEYFIHGIDWITKKKLLEVLGSARTEEAITLCNQYDLVDASAMYFLEGCRKEAESFFAPEEALRFLADLLPYSPEDVFASVQSGLLHGPQSTREKRRGELINANTRQVEKASWGKVYTGEGIINLPDPLR